MCQRAGQDGRPTAWWTQPVSADTFPASAPAVTDTAVVPRAADAPPDCVLSDPASLVSCRENACRSPVPPGDRAGSLG